MTIRRVRSKHVEPGKGKPAARLQGGGHPGFEPTKDQRFVVEQLRAAQHDEPAIAQQIINPTTGKHIDIHTLQKHFAEELKCGSARIFGKIDRGLINAATGHEGIPNPNYKKKDPKTKLVDHERWLKPPRAPDLGSIIWFDKTRRGIKDTVRNELTDGQGNPLPPATVVVHLPTNGRETGGEGNAVQTRAQVNGHDKAASAARRGNGAAH